ncbi:hypothetical protein [Dysgonomonas sp. GY617]|uniref:hypothetical protein n=1 Tax=Dysgonomonas sp. GY617 TaxID=2780420 RepID=UPI0018841365|nr:hypothetical protein [Dysgonomonas sp. GY617]MBF0576000.1 hypothetical protein [Dysgonomonas sp. GY617]
MVVIILVSFFYKRNKRREKFTLLLFRSISGNGGIDRLSSLNNEDLLSYLSVILLKNNVNINRISTTSHEDDIFLPYLYLEDKDVIANPLDIRTGTILKIPLLSEEILNMNNPQSIRRIRFLTDSILNNVTESF